MSDTRQLVDKLWNFCHLLRDDGVTAAAGGATVPTGFANRLHEHMIETAAIRQTRHSSQSRRPSVPTFSTVFS